jgi:hypothetical protein
MIQVMKRKECMLINIYKKERKGKRNVNICINKKNRKVKEKELNKFKRRKNNVRIKKEIGEAD